MFLTNKYCFYLFQTPFLPTVLMYRTVTCGLAPMVYVFAMSEVRFTVEDKIEDKIKVFVIFADTYSVDMLADLNPVINPYI